MSNDLVVHGLRGTTHYYIFRGSRTAFIRKSRQHLFHTISSSLYKYIHRYPCVLHFGSTTSLSVRCSLRLRWHYCCRREISQTLYFRHSSTIFNGPKRFGCFCFLCKNRSSSHAPWRLSQRVITNYPSLRNLAIVNWLYIYILVFRKWLQEPVRTTQYKPNKVKGRSRNSSIS